MSQERKDNHSEREYFKEGEETPKTHLPSKPHGWQLCHRNSMVKFNHHVKGLVHKPFGCL